MSPEDSHKLIAEMFLRQEMMISEIKSIKAQLAGHPAIVDGWMSAKEAAIALKPESIKTARQLHQLRYDGVLSESKLEIWNKSGGERPTWLYHVPNCRKALQRRFKGTRALG